MTATQIQATPNDQDVVLGASSFSNVTFEKNGSNLVITVNEDQNVNTITMLGYFDGNGDPQGTVKTSFKLQESDLTARTLQWGLLPGSTTEKGIRLVVDKHDVAENQEIIGVNGIPNVLTGTAAVDEVPEPDVPYTNTITGSDAADTITGGAGVDTIRGGQGNDVISGGTGNDKFIFNPGDGVDTILNIETGDVIKLGSPADPNVPGSGQTVVASYKRVGADLEISYKIKDSLGAGDKVILKNFDFAGAGKNASVELYNLAHGGGADYDDAVPLDDPSIIIDVDLTGTAFVGDNNYHYNLNVVSGTTNVSALKANDNIVIGDDVVLSRVYKTGDAKNNTLTLTSESGIVNITDFAFNGDKAYKLNGTAMSTAATPAINVTAHNNYKKSGFTEVITPVGNISYTSDGLTALADLDAADKVAFASETTYSYNGTAFVVSDGTNSIAFGLAGNPQAPLAGQVLVNGVADDYSTKTLTATGVAGDWAAATKAPLFGKVDITATAGAITGGNGDDVINGGVTISGGEGNDTINGAANTTAINGGEGNDTIDASAATGAIAITGGKGNDTITASTKAANVDTFNFVAGDGNDTITGAAKEDILAIAGVGADLSGLKFEKVEGDLKVSYNENKDSVTVKDYFTTDADKRIEKVGTVPATVAWNDDEAEMFNVVAGDANMDGTGSGIRNIINTANETVTVQAGNEGDIINIGATAAAVAVTGGEGNDAIDASAATAAITITGGKGNDTIKASAQADVFKFNIDGEGKGDGADVIIGANNLDTITFGDGVAEYGNVAFTKAENNKDLLVSYNENKDSVTVKDYFTAKAENRVTDIRVNDAGAPAKKLEWNDAFDEMFNVQADVNGSIDAVNGIRNDITFGAVDGGAFTVRGGDKDDIIDASKATTAGIGTNVNQGILGLEGDDHIIGSDFADYIDGGEGDDYIESGKGNDVITGGVGNDFFVFEKGDGDNRITDAKLGDVIEFGEGIKFKNLEFAQGNDDIYPGTDATQLVITYDAGNTVTIDDYFINTNIGGGAPVWGIKPDVVTTIIADGTSYTFKYNAGDEAATTQYDIDDRSDFVSPDGTKGVTINDKTIQDRDITGSNYNDSITLKGGNNVVSEDAGVNKVTLGAGNDVFAADEYSSNNVKLGAGDNVARLDSVGNNKVASGAGNDKIFANAGTNKVNAGNGDNIIGVGAAYQNGEFIDLAAPSTAVNNITTGKGKDKVYLNGGNNTVKTGKGDDTVDIQGGYNVISSADGINTFNIDGGGIFEYNKITGGKGKDIFNVNAASTNVLKGGKGDDEFTVDGGANTLDGGAGADKFIINAGDNYIKGGKGNDIYDLVHFDFTGEDSVTIVDKSGKNDLNLNGDNDLFAMFDVKLKHGKGKASNEITFTTDGDLDNSNATYVGKVNTFSVDGVASDFNVKDVTTQVVAWLKENGQTSAYDAIAKNVEGVEDLIALYQVG